MEEKKHFRLFGFMEYVPMDTGFVTPVFCDGPNFFIQVVNEDNSIAFFEEFADYNHRVHRVKSSKIYKSDGDDCIFGFKRFNEYHYDSAPELVKQLISGLEEFEENEYLLESISSFIETYSRDIKKYHAIFPEVNSVWDYCLSILEQAFGEKLSNIYRDAITYTEYNGRLLSLHFKNETLKRIFDQQSANHLRLKCQETYGPGFEIQTVCSQSNKCHLKTHWLSLPRETECNKKEYHLEGTFHMATSINPHLKFDNFYLSTDNKDAFYTCLEFATGGGTKGNILITGSKGTGKSHLLNAIGNYLDNYVDIVVAWFSFERNAMYYTDIKLKGPKEFESISADAQVILVDNSHHFIDNDNSEKYRDALVRLMYQGKSVVLSSDIEEYDIGVKYFPRKSDNNYTHINLDKLKPRERINLLKKKTHFDQLGFKYRLIINCLAYSTNDISGLFNQVMHYYLNDGLFRSKNKSDEKKENPLRGKDHYPVPHHMDQNNNDLSLLKSIVLQKMGSVDRRLDHVCAGSYDELASNIVLFIYEVYLNNSIDILSISGIKAIATRNYTFAYWQQEFFDNYIFRKLIIDIYSELVSNVS